MWIDDTIRYREKVRKRNELILAELKRGVGHADLARKYKVSRSIIGLIPKKFEAEKKRKDLWGNLSVRVVELLKKLFGFACLRDLMDSPMFEQEFLMTRGVGGVTLNEIKMKTGKFRVPLKSDEASIVLDKLLKDHPELSCEAEELRRRVRAGKIE